MSFSPIAIFVYKRPIHTKRMVDSLIKNNEYMDSPITVYCDGPRTEQDIKEVAETRGIIKKMLPKANLIEQDENQGIAASIINGVSEQCKKYGRVIVFEDDLVLSSDVLRYFNKALDYYEADENVMHVSGYTLPVERELPSTFFFREASCWGWSTWERAWKNFEPDSKLLADYLFSNQLLKEFNVNNSYPYWEMLLARINNEIDSWAILWYASIFMNKGLALFPGKSKIQNTGFDGSGNHCGRTTQYDVDLYEGDVNYPAQINENNAALEAIVEFRKKGIMSFIDHRIRNFRAVARYLMGNYK